MLETCFTSHKNICKIVNQKIAQKIHYIYNTTISFYDTTADQLFAAKTAIRINRGAESDYGPEQILPIGSKRIITQYEKNEKLFFYMNLGELDKSYRSFK